MRATGIVRRIDELGRVVIPKEIRRTLRIREGDPLEIYTDKDGEVILKKYSPIGEISNFAKDYTESLFRSLGHIACITDKDMIVSASGVSRKELWEKPISRDLEQAIQSRQVVTANRGNGTRLVPVTSEEDAQAYTAQVICPIIADGESIGAVVLLSRGVGYCLKRWYSLFMHAVVGVVLASTVVILPPVKLLISPGYTFAMGLGDWLIYAGCFAAGAVLAWALGKVQGKE